MIIILGGGITGLSVASNIVSEQKNLILEKTDRVGGYCKTTRRGEYIWDKAGHFFHFQRDYIKKFFEKKISDDNFVKVNKKTSIYINNRYIDFPFQKNIHQLDKKDYIACLVDLYIANKEQNISTNFKNYVINNYGKTIADMFLIPYNEKLYACDLNHLDKNAMGRFFPKAKFEDVLLNFNNTKNESYNNSFLYPKQGSEVFIDAILPEALKTTNIKVNSEVISVDIRNKQVLLKNGENITYTTLINTLPLDYFCKISKISDTTINTSLSANKVLVFNIGFNIPLDVKFHWVYFPGNEIFYRVGSYSNILGASHGSIYVEIGLSSEKDYDFSNNEIMLEKIIIDLTKVGFISSTHRVMDFEVVLMDPAYVHISEKSEIIKENLFDVFEKNDVYSIGRYGEWKYCSIEDNIHDANELTKKLARKYSKIKLTNCFSDE